MRCRDLSGLDEGAPSQDVKLGRCRIARLDSFRTPGSFQVSGLHACQRKLCDSEELQHDSCLQPSRCSDGARGRTIAMVRYRKAVGDARRSERWTLKLGAHFETSQPALSPLLGKSTQLVDFLQSPTFLPNRYRYRPQHSCNENTNHSSCCFCRHVGPILDSMRARIE